MQVIVIEATDGVDWRPFLVCRTQATDFEHADVPLFQRTGWSTESVWVLDMRSGFGVIVLSDGLPTDLYLSVEFSSLFRSFLSWLLSEDLSSLDALPHHVDLSPDIRTVRADGLVVEAIFRDNEYEIVSVQDDHGQPVLDVDLERMEAALDEAESTSEFIKQKKPMERATGAVEKTVAKRRQVG